MRSRSEVVLWSRCGLLPVQISRWTPTYSKLFPTPSFYNSSSCLCAQFSGEREGDWGRSGGAEWWVTALECARAPNSLCSRRSRRHSARAARDRSGSARRRQDNAAGAGGMMAVSEKTGQVWYCKNWGFVGENSAPSTMKQVGGESLTKLFTFVRCCV